METMTKKRTSEAGYGLVGLAGLEGRIRRARELRRTCSSCGRTGLEERIVEKRSQPGRCECGGRAFEVTEIGARLGVKKSAVSEYLRGDGRGGPRRRRQTGTCGECGGPCAGRENGRGKEAVLCRWCQAGELSPHRRESSPTGFRDWTSRVCGTPGCEERKAEGHHVCAEHAERLAAIREEMTGSDWREEYNARRREEAAARRAEVFAAAA